jgi:hypothetical protein
VDAVRMLIEHGADLTTQNDVGVTSGVNSTGVITRLYRTARIMLELGANVNAKNKNRLAPFGRPRKVGLLKLYVPPPCPACGHDHRSGSKRCGFVLALDILVA